MALRPADFKSAVSADFTIRARVLACFSILADYRCWLLVLFSLDDR